MQFNSPLDALRHHVSGAVARGSATSIVAIEAPMQVPGRTFCKVSIESTAPDEVFDAYVMTGYRWNGWACPAFTFDQALRVQAWVERVGGSPVLLDSDGVTFIVVTGGLDGDGLLEDEDIYVERLAPDEHGLYSIGSHSWIWSEVEDDDDLD